MFEKKISFYTSSFLLEDKKLYPEPTNKHIPEWFKNLKTSFGYVGNTKNILNHTVKTCMPFLDALKTGYILKASLDIYFNHNFINTEKDNITDTRVLVNTSPQHAAILSRRLNINVGGEGHDISQLGGEECPFVHDNKGKKFFKILNPWIIKTPPGYSTLFLPPLNNPDKRFTPFSGIVDTDTFNLEVNFPVTIHQEGEWILKKYSPIICAFPFKRDNWKSEIKSISIQEKDKENYNFATRLVGYYKDVFWKAKKWI